VLHEEGACDIELAEFDWCTVPERDLLQRARTAVAEFMSGKTKREVLEASLERKLLAAPILTVADIAESEQLEARSFWSSSETTFCRARSRTQRRRVRVPASCAPARRAQRRGLRRDSGAAGMSERAFTGLRVLDLCWVVAGPAVGRVLADHGAEVVRVESSTRLDTARLIGPFHDGAPTAESSILYGDVNAGKLGLTLNLGLEQGRDVLRGLVRRSDVVLESFSPGVMDGWGLGYEELRALNESVIVLSTSLMGQTGPLGRFAGYGNIGAAMSGFQSLVGGPTGCRSARTGRTATTSRRDSRS